MNIDVMRELEEFRPYLKVLQPINPQCTKLAITTKEDIVLEVEWTVGGLIVSASSAALRKQSYDDLGQLLNEVSPAYRDSFMQSLFSKLANQESEEL